MHDPRSTAPDDSGAEGVPPAAGAPSPPGWDDEDVEWEPDWTDYLYAWTRIDYLLIRYRVRKWLFRLRCWWQPLTDEELLARGPRGRGGQAYLEWLYAKLRQPPTPEDLLAESPCEECGRVILCGPHPCGVRATNNDHEDDAA
jgi:hypothetical protein